MRILLLSLLVTMAPLVHAQGWYRYQDLPLNTAPRQASVNNAGTVYLLTRERRILRKPLAGAWINISPAAIVSPECISADPTSGHVYVGTAREGLFRSADQGATWQLFWLETSPVTGFHEGYKCLTQSSTSGTFFGGHFGAPLITRFTANGSAGVIRTITTNPNASPVAIHLAQNGDLFVGTHLGIWRSQDQGDSFVQTALGTGLVYDFAEGATGTLYALHQDLGNGNTLLLRSTDGVAWEEVPTPAEELVSIHFHSGPGELWLGTRQGIHMRAEGASDWTDMSGSDGPYRVVQVSDDRNGSVLAFSDPYLVQQFNGSTGTWSSATTGLVGAADRIVFAADNAMFALSQFGSNLVSHLVAGTDLWEYALLENSLTGVHEVFTRMNGQVFASTIRALHRSDDGGLTFSPTALPAPYADLQTGYIDLFAATEEALYVKHTNLPYLLFTSVDDGATWTVASDISAVSAFARFDRVARSASGTLYSLQTGPHTNSLPNLFSSVDNGANWTLVPHNYADFINSFNDHELKVFGDRLFLIGPRKVYEVIEGSPPVIQDLQVPFINTSVPLVTFKVDSDGRYIIQASSGVHRYNGVSWDLLGMPNVVQPGAPPFADLQRYDDLPFVIVAANTPGMVSGIYCYLDISTGTDDPVSRTSTRVYPNPATGALTIEAASPVRSAVWMDNAGRILRTEHFAPGNRVQVDLQRHSPGCYLLKLITDGGVEVHRVVLD